jgi:hypothetical protein
MHFIPIPNTTTALVPTVILNITKENIFIMATLGLDLTVPTATMVEI